ncbi:aspartate-semialdehyde dehydrogenase [Streptomyces sp. NPDC050704]|uniref:aspartate-semialdehyde dehydrogenase n=1 Tax=Streptomyces sp. NPDC050704 TaxID=3157219 RepID=UPI0034134FD2
MLSIAIVGATGAVGRECLALLDRGIVPVERVLPVGSPRSVGRDVGAEFGLDLPLDPLTTVEELAPDDLDVGLFCAGAEVSAREAERLTSAGVLVVDNSSAFRMRADVPLVVPQVNPHALARRPSGGIVANPNCSTIQLVRALHPLHELAGLESVVVATYQAASGGGLRGLAELAGDSAKLLSDPGTQSEPGGRFGQPLAFNLVPEVGLRDETGLTHEERKLVREPRKILGLPDLRVSATAVRVPVFHCHSEAVHIRLREPVTGEAVEKALANACDLRVYGRSAGSPYPMPRFVFGEAEDRVKVHVGRIRVEPEDPRAVAVWIVADNLWVGAALNALQIVELGVSYGWLG